MFGHEIIPGLHERDQISVILKDMKGEMKPEIDLSFLFDAREVDRAMDIYTGIKEL